MQGVIIAAVLVGVVGLVIGLLLGIAGVKFEVEVDEKEVEVRECLPGNNCGGCGYAGCDGLAAAIAKGDAAVNACPVASDEDYKKIGAIMGVDAEETEKQVAFVKCSGTCDKTKVKYHYYGIHDCRKLALIPGNGDKACDKGCLGYGSCVSVCMFDAIHIENGVAVVDKDKCKSCGKCVSACPKGIIELVPYKANKHVVCSSTAKAKDVMAVCEAGCRGCKVCEKFCEAKAITVENNIAKIDYDKCTGCGVCAEKCPAKVIK